MTPILPSFRIHEARSRIGKTSRLALWQLRRRRNRCDLPSTSALVGQTFSISGNVSATGANAAVALSGSATGSTTADAPETTRLLDSPTEHTP